MNCDPFGPRATETGSFRDGNVYDCRVDVGDPVNSERGLVRESNIRVFRSVTCFGPENGLAVLRELGLWIMSDPVDPSRGTFEPTTLRQPHEDGVEDAGIACLFRGQQAVILFGNSN